MSINTKPTSLSLAILILSLLLISPPSSCNNFQIFHVSNSLQQTRHIFSQSSLQQQNHHITTSPPPSLSLPLHSLSSAAAANNNHNYTSLTLSRLARDQSRLRHLLSKINPKSKNPNLKFPVTSGFGQGTGEYLARIGVGRPAKQFYIAIDTGSDVSWLQCRPCVACYAQSDPIFNPINSATYKPLPCTSRRCAALDSSACLRGNCLYQVSYGDGSSTVGTFATETISVGEQSLTVAIGCGHDNEGLFAGSAGILGLGGGNLSLPSQIKAASFSYCLVDRDSESSSTLDFNSTAPADSIVAPMLKNPQIETYLYVGLTGISVGGKSLPIRRRDRAAGEGRGDRGLGDDGDEVSGGGLCGAAQRVQEHDGGAAARRGVLDSGHVLRSVWVEFGESADGVVSVQRWEDAGAAGGELPDGGGWEREILPCVCGDGGVAVDHREYSAAGDTCHF